MSVTLFKQLYSIERFLEKNDVIEFSDNVISNETICQVIQYPNVLTFLPRIKNVLFSYYENDYTTFKTHFISPIEPFIKQIYIRMIELESNLLKSRIFSFQNEHICNYGDELKQILSYLNQSNDNNILIFVPRLKAYLVTMYDHIDELCGVICNLVYDFWNQYNSTPNTPIAIPKSSIYELLIQMEHHFLNQGDMSREKHRFIVHFTPFTVFDDLCKVKKCLSYFVTNPGDISIFRYLPYTRFYLSSINECYSDLEEQNYHDLIRLSEQFLHYSKQIY
jgi:hypothetical protein